MESKPILSRFGILPLVPRDLTEPHRRATPLELLFDLISVIAVAFAAAGLHHAILDFRITEGVLKFSASFFAIWWAWMSFTWYASAYDNNDSLHRVLTIVAMAGSLIMAAGIERFFQTNNISMIVAGFVVIRLAMVCFWLRAAGHDLERRLTAYRYAAGIAIVQVYWLGLMLAQPVAVNLLVFFYAVGALFELMVPAYAESNYSTPWHRLHLIERYGLFNIIVLGETLLAGSLAIQQVASDNMGMELIGIAISSLILMFSLWWVYFSQEEHVAHPRLSLALLWGYGHLLIYMSGAAVGVGVAVLTDVVTGYSSLSKSVGLYTIAVASSGYLFGLWLIRERFELEGPGRYILLLTAVVLLFSPLILPIEGIAALLVLGVAVRNQYACTSVKQETQSDYALTDVKKVDTMSIAPIKENYHE